MSAITHDRPECTGNWRLIRTGDDHAVRCDRCGARHPASLENRQAAVNENYAGEYLRRLTTEGQAQLEAQRRDGAP